MARKKAARSRCEGVISERLLLSHFAFAWVSVAVAVWEEGDEQVCV